jgi:hypothetical protein
MPPKKYFLILIAAFAFSQPAWAWEVSGHFSVEFTFKPLLPPLAAIDTELVLTISVATISLGSETTFDITGLKSQVFTLQTTVEILTLQNKLTFEPGFDFSRNVLEGSIEFNKLQAALILIHADIGLMGIQPGLVIELGGEIEGVLIESYTGFGVTEVVKDLDKDGVPDRNVTTPFAFTEEVIELEFTINSFYLKSITTFTPLGLEEQILEIGIDLPRFWFTSTTTFDSTLLLVEEQVEMGVVIDALELISRTMFVAPPLTFDGQEFEVSLILEGLSITSITAFNSTFFFIRQDIIIILIIDGFEFKSTTVFTSLGLQSNEVELTFSWQNFKFTTATVFDLTGLLEQRFGVTIFF